MPKAVSKRYLMIKRDVHKTHEKSIKNLCCFDSRPLLGCSWLLLGRSWRLLVALGVLLVALGSLLGRSWAALGRSWAALGSLLGRSWPLLAALRALLGPTWSKMNAYSAEIRWRPQPRRCLPLTTPYLRLRLGMQLQSLQASLKALSVILESLNGPGHLEPYVLGLRPDFLGPRILDLGPQV